MGTFKTIAMVLLLSVSVCATAQTKKEKKIMKDALKAKKELIRTDSGIEKFFTNSAGYVIFPNVGKGGFIVGAASGNGVLYEGGIPQGMADLKKLDVGFQAGGQAVIEAIFFETKDDMLQFKEEKFQFSADISAVALKSGVSANAKYRNGVAVFTLPKSGLMAEVSVGGQKFGYDTF
ncbi:hypothetical protein LCGC14_1444720 [marine sediment metagenome]|uniref:Ysc84 actin-binding domain-containing protein n=2 Tax=root TaxID=1 RepID=A0A831QVH6_9FLAO|nr:hypothetical protein [Pricia antarctica]